MTGDDKFWTEWMVFRIMLAIVVYALLALAFELRPAHADYHGCVSPDCVYYNYGVRQADQFQDTPYWCDPHSWLYNGRPCVPDDNGRLVIDRYYDRGSPYRRGQ